MNLQRQTSRHLDNTITLLLYLGALLCAVYGNTVLRGADVLQRDEALELAAGSPYLWIAVVLWLFAELIDNWRALRNWWSRLERTTRARWLARILPMLFGLAGISRLIEALSAPPDHLQVVLGDAFGRFALAVFLLLLIDISSWRLRSRAAALFVFVDQVKGALSNQQESAWFRLSSHFGSRQTISSTRLYLLGASLLSSAVLLINTTGNSFRPPIIALWILSAILWSLTFAPLEWNIVLWLYRKLNADGRILWRDYWWAYFAFALIMSVGISFRFGDLESMPAELTNDPYLNLLDSYEFAQGLEQPIYFNQNNGREPLSFWWVALLASVPGLGFDYYTLKLSTALVSTLALPLMLWVGIEFMGENRRKTGVVAGLLLSGFVAGSYWEVVASRFGDLHSWVSFFAALVTLLLIRAIRHNRRGDFILVGLALGFGLYAYKSLIFMPIAVAACIIFAMASPRMSRRERARYVGNLAVLFTIAFSVLLPLFQYVLEFPKDYFRRASQLVFDPASSLAGESAFIWELLATVLNAIQKHLLMFNWRGDQNLVRNLPGAPALDVFAGALLILGLVAIATRMLRSRDPILWMLPILLVIGHLPSILVFAPYTAGEIPSTTRTLLVLPHIYLIAAFALTVIARQFMRSLPKPIALLFATLLCFTLALLAYQQNRRLYFETYRDHLVSRILPSSDGGEILSGFADSGGAVGNAFIVYGGDMGEPRFIAGAAGVLTYPNIIWNVSDIPQAIEQAMDNEAYRLDSNRDVLFLYSPINTAATEELKRLFPEGHLLVIPTYNQNFSYAAYRVPAPGQSRLVRFVHDQSH